MYNTKDKKRRKNKMTEDEIRMLWWLHESEQLEEKITKEEIDEINEHVRGVRRSQFMGD